MLFHSFSRVAALAMCGAFATVAQAADISGAGATFPFPIYAKWADAYKKETGNGLNYQSIGSGAGIKQIKAKTVTFGATDAPLKAKDLDEGRPRAMADGDGRHRAGRQSRRREARRHRARRPDARQDLPRQDHQMERSGDQEAQPQRSSCPTSRSPSSIAPTARAPPSTSPTISAKVSPDWKSKVGVATTVEWPAGIGAKGNDGVANNVATTKGAIGYVEYAYAKQNKLTFADMINKAGKTVAPTMDAFQAAAANADWADAPGFYHDPGQPAGRQVVADDRRDLHPDVQEAGRRRRLATTRSSSSTGPTTRATRWREDLDYIPMPDKVVELVKAMWAKDIEQK